MRFHIVLAVFLVALKINTKTKNTKKEQAFENLRIDISASPSALALTFQILFLLYDCFLFFFKCKICFFLYLIIRNRYILLQLLITLLFPIHLSRGFYWCSRKKAISGHSLFQKNSCSENFWNFPSKTSMVKSLLNTIGGLCGSFPNSCLGQLFWREPFTAYFYKK